MKIKAKKTTIKEALTAIVKIPGAIIKNTLGKNDPVKKEPKRKNNKVHEKGESKAMKSKEKKMYKK